MTLLETIRAAIARTAVLPALGARVVAERGFFHFDLPSTDVPGSWVGMARALPLAGSAGLLLEAPNSRGGYFAVARGSVATIVRALAEGASGTFHGLGPLERRARSAGCGAEREKLRRAGGKFVYASDGTTVSSVQEVLYHHFGLPLTAVNEPDDWYAYHRTPAIREAKRDRVLVRFAASSFSGRDFEGACLYAKRDGVWGAYKIRPNASARIATAEAWLVKRGWDPWE